MNVRLWQYVWAAVVLLAVCLIILFETGLLPEGSCVGDASVQYVCDCVALALSLIGIYVGMKSEGRPWLRLLCFGIPLVLSLLVYYLFVSATTLACAAAIGVAMLLQWPRAHTPEI
ncbi:MAG: hypothetical protein ACI4B5_00835 [Bacteroidaceae bacterium]